MGRAIAQGLISIHAPAWGATRGILVSYLQCADFNPRARVGRDRSPSLPEPSVLISIHAPAWGATKRFLDELLAGAFQSTRPRGARRRVDSCASSRAISIHAPVWGATVAALDDEIAVVISIHAPVWGATTDCARGKRMGAFQSTRPCGARLEHRTFHHLLAIFQSTRPCGARLLLGVRLDTN